MNQDESILYFGNKENEISEIIKLLESNDIPYRLETSKDIVGDEDSNTSIIILNDDFSKAIKLIPAFNQFESTNDTNENELPYELANEVPYTEEDYDMYGIVEEDVEIDSDTEEADKKYEKENTEEINNDYNKNEEDENYDEMYQDSSDENPIKSGFSPNLLVFILLGVTLILIISFFVNFGKILLN